MKSIKSNSLLVALAIAASSPLAIAEARTPASRQREKTLRFAERYASPSKKIGPTSAQQREIADWSAAVDRRNAEKLEQKVQRMVKGGRRRG